MNPIRAKHHSSPPVLVNKVFRCFSIAALSWQKLCQQHWCLKSLFIIGSLLMHSNRINPAAVASSWDELFDWKIFFNNLSQTKMNFYWFQALCSHSSTLREMWSIRPFNYWCLSTWLRFCSPFQAKLHQNSDFMVKVTSQPECLKLSCWPFVIENLEFPILLVFRNAVHWLFTTTLLSNPNPS